MTISRDTLAFPSILGVILSVLGYFTFSTVFSFFEPHIEGIHFQITDDGNFAATHLLFSIVLLLTPIFIVLTWHVARIRSSNKKNACTLLVLTVMIMAIFLRHQMVKMYFTRVVKPALLPNGSGNIIYPINPVNFVYYMFAALCSGCILSYFLFRKK